MIASRTGKILSQAASTKAGRCEQWFQLHLYKKQLNFRERARYMEENSWFDFHVETPQIFVLNRDFHYRQDSHEVELAYRAKLFLKCTGLQPTKKPKNLEKKKIDVWRAAMYSFLLSLLG